MCWSKDELARHLLLYAITDRTWLQEGEELFSLCEDILREGVSFLQLREKHLEEEALCKEAVALQDLCRNAKIPFVINDRLDLALSLDLDGVHLGQSDLQGKDPRRLLGPKKILGISASTVDEARAAEMAGADYLGVGAVFPTTTKKDARTLSREALGEIVAAVSIPVVAIGGIGEDNLLDLSGTGIAGVAVISAIFGSEDPASAARRLVALSREVLGHG